MKNFIVKISIFFLPIFIVAIAMEISLRSIPNDYSFKRNVLDVSSNNIETLILGSSHAYYGIDPIYFSTNCFNASHISQSLNYDLEILRKYENQLGKLKTIILPISYFTLFGVLQKGTESWRVKNYVIYYDMNTSDSITDFTEILSNTFATNIKRLYSYFVKGSSNISCSTSGWGISYNSQNSKDLVESGKTAALRHTRKDHRYLNENIATLKSILEFSQRHTVKVVLFTPPAFMTYVENLNQDQLDLTFQVTNEIATSSRNGTYLNLLKEDSFSSEDFYDADHLNEIGAKKLSSMINDHINRLNNKELHTKVSGI